MTQIERRTYLIRELLQEREPCEDIELPTDEREQKRLLRALFNVRAPRPANRTFLEIQDAYLQAEIAAKGIIDSADLSPVQEGLYLWQGDITTLKCDAIVNAANSALLGCFCPGHHCVDNAIHTFSGVQLRSACAALMNRQGHAEPAGRAKLTPAFNLPCRYVLHTVGPMVEGEPTERDCELLAACYRSCLALAEEKNAESLAFCCLSTGEFCFPNRLAAEIAVKTVKKYRRQTHSQMKVIFNVFKEIDWHIYRALLGAAPAAS